jgi:hypothetical protein
MHMNKPGKGRLYLAYSADAPRTPAQNVTGTRLAALLGPMGTAERAAMMGEIRRATLDAALLIQAARAGRDAENAASIEPRPH